MSNTLFLPEFGQSNVLVVGDVMLDRYWHGDTARISPEAPVPVVHIQQHDDRPGGAGNVAFNISSLGGNVQLSGRRGDDEAGQILENKLTLAGVQCAFAVHPTQPTITKLRVMSQHQQLIRLDFEEKTQQADPRLLENVKNSIAQQQALILSDYGKGALPEPQAFIQLAREHQCPVLVDPKGQCFERYRGATVLTPNRKEFEIVMGVCANEEMLVERGMQALTKYDIEALLITRGSEGMTLLQRDHAPLHLPALSRDVFDVTGAGDTVIATLALALAAGTDLQNATELANLSASIAVSKAGTVAVSLPELQSAVAQHQDVDHGVMTEAQLTLAVAAAQARGEKIVFTNGCFDILHAGHVDNLQQAKQFGDRLIVAVNDDASVARLKGPGRPINSVQQRMQVLTHLASVDWVVAFSEDTPQRLIEALSPEVLAKGGDYDIEEIAGSAHVIATGGEVKLIPLVQGCSSTNVINTIQDKETA